MIRLLPLAAAACAAFLLLYHLPTHAQSLPKQVTGKVHRVIDGDTLDIAGPEGLVRVRLWGIDTPEKGQACQDAENRKYPCGEYAGKALKAIVANDELECTARGKPSYNRMVAECFIVRGQYPSVNRMMVMHGWALAYRQYSKSFVPDEDAAFKANAGMWSGSFHAPECFRHDKSCPVLGKGRR